MLRRARSVVVWASLGAAVVAPRAARAQTIPTAAGPSITASGQVNPERFLPSGGNPLGIDKGQSTRAQTLNPLGVNFQDCELEMTLQFSVNVSGFDGSENLQVWATASGDCTQSADRGINSSAATCWIVNTGSTAVNAQSAQVKNYTVSVRDLVGPEAGVPFPPTYTSYGEEACHAQTNFPAIPLTIYFLPLDQTNAVVGTPYKYPIKADLVGPPAPSGVSIADGDTLFVVNWTPNTDSDTSGYDVYIDPAPGQINAAGNGTTGSGTSCPSTLLTQASSGSGSGTSSGSSSSGASSGSAASGSSSSGASSGSASSGASSGGASSGAVPSGIGGVSTLPAQNILGANPATGSTVSGLNNGSHTVTGLQNGATYTVAVSAVDGSGNVGPPSTQVCDYPAPVSDFWRIYRTDGGGAGGGFCALDAVGAPAGLTVAFVGLGAAAIALGRRRRMARR